MTTQTNTMKITLTDKQSNKLFHYPNKTLRIKRNYIWYYVSRFKGIYTIKDWTGKEYYNIEVSQ
jgi:hypothetical protein